jgi:light-regulated signal transduction histidine kinase (bacteriophytochrome)
MRNMAQMALLFFLLICLGILGGLVADKINSLKAQQRAEQRTVDQHLKSDSINLKEQKDFIDLLAHERDSLLDVIRCLQDSVKQLKPKTVIIPDNYGRQTIKF